jgi:hypothetical protein
VTTKAFFATACDSGPLPGVRASQRRILSSITSSLTPYRCRELRIMRSRIWGEYASVRRGTETAGNGRVAMPLTPSLT